MVGGFPFDANVRQLASDTFAADLPVVRPVRDRIATLDTSKGTVASTRVPRPERISRKPPIASSRSFMLRRPGPLDPHDFVVLGRQSTAQSDSPYLPLLVRWDIWSTKLRPNISASLNGPVRCFSMLATGHGRNSNQHYFAYSPSAPKLKRN